MNKKNEKKILDELTRRVLEKDKELQEKKESANVINSNKEALVEMTNLSKQEIDSIEKQVRAEIMANAKKATTRRNWLIIAGVVVLLIAYNIIMRIINKEPPPELMHFTETFDNNNNGWDIFNEYEIKRKIENGVYNFNANRDDWCFWDEKEIILPSHYSISLKTTWKRGSFDEYGLMLMQDSENYHTFVIRADGNTANSVYKGNTWIKLNSWTTSKFATNDEVTQTIEVKGNKYLHKVNEVTKHEGSLEDMKISKFALRVCDKQIVDFNSIEIKNLATGEIIFSDDFKETSNNWDEKEKRIKESTIENGKYIYTTDDTDQCYWAVSNPKITLPPANTSKYTVRIKMYWLTGEDANFGVMFLADDLNYTAFQTRSSGDSRSIRCENDQYTIIPDFIKTGILSDEKHPINMIIHVDGNNYEFFLNDTKISIGDFNYMNINYLGLRVCGHQTIVFDEIEIIQEK